MALNEKQQRFCAEYLVDMNATQAAIRSGYSDKTAYSQGQRLLKHVEIKAQIEAELNRIRTEKIADATEIMEYLTSVLRGESQSEIVVVENIGDYTSEARRIQKSPDEKERLKAAELLGKRYNLFSDKMRVDVALPVVISGGEDLAD